MKPEPEDASRAAFRRSLYLLLIAVGIGGVLGRILAVNSVNAIELEKRLQKEGRAVHLQRPFLSGNDRSRWNTVRALVEHGTYQIDAIIQEPGWDTLDMVKHDGHGNPAPGPDEGHLYSSKPPLLATLAAGPYWLLVRTTGWTLGTHPFVVGRILLVLVSAVPLLVYFLSLARLVERYGRGDWPRVFVMAAGVFGTFLTTFAVVFNNHLPAAMSVALALEAALRISLAGERRWRDFIMAGLFGAFAVANELPSLAFFAAMMAALLLASWRQTLLGALVPAALVALAFVGANYLAHGTWQLAYGQRHTEGGWYQYQYQRGARVIDSAWIKPSNPIDQGEPNIGLYAFQVLVGHHGVFSLTPVWLLSALGCFAWWPQGKQRRLLGLAILLISVVCLSFYILRPLEDRNYGGMTSGFRWAFWMAPLWLVAMLPAADLLSRHRWTQGGCLLLLAASVMSVAYPTWNPWVHPWLLDYLLSIDAVGLGPR